MLTGLELFLPFYLCHQGLQSSLSCLNHRIFNALFSISSLWCKFTAAEVKMIMHRVLTHHTLRRAAAVCPNLVGGAFVKPSAACCCCVLHLWPPPLCPTSQRWVSTSAFCKSAHLPKPQSPEEEARSRSTSQEQSSDAQPGAPDVDPLQDRSIGLFQRFKKTFKQYGKVMIPVHLLTSSVWFGTFYYAAMK